jgi:hypothetical protein
MSNTLDIKFKDVTAVSHFVAATMDAPFEVDLRSGRYMVDAKSLLGVYNILQFGRVTLEIISKDERAIEEYLRQIEPYIEKF